MNNTDPLGEGILDELKWYVRGMEDAPTAFVGGVKGAAKAAASGVASVYNFFYEGVGGVIYENTGWQQFSEQGQQWADRRDRFQKALRAGPAATVARSVNDTSAAFNRRLEVGDVEGASEVIGAVGLIAAAMSQGLPPGEFGPAPALVTSAGVVARGVTVPAVGAGPLIAPVVLANAADDGAKEGRYEFPDQTADGVPYVGQSGNMPRRLKKHQKAGRLIPGTETRVEVPGGKTAREISEHERIQKLTQGVPARLSPKVSNKVDPIGPNRRHLLNGKKGTK